MNTRRTILDEAANLFAEIGYTRASMSMLADRVGIRKASLYHHFQRKHELLVGVLDELMALMLAKANDGRYDQMSPRDTLRAVIGDVLGLMVTHPGHFRVFFEEYRNVDRELLDEPFAKRTLYAKIIVDAIEHGIDSGEFIDCDARLAAMAMYGLCNSSFQWIRDDRYEVTEVAELFSTIFLDGLAFRD